MNKNKFKKLTSRELQILKLFKQGFSNREIAKKIGLTIHTVKGWYMVSIYKKLGIETKNINGRHKSRKLQSALCECHFK